MASLLTKEGAPRLPCSDNNFYVIVALWSLNYVADLHAALADIHRVLRPGGRFLALVSSEGHLEDLVSEVGGINRERFTAENGMDSAESTLHSDHPQVLADPSGVP